jgi:prostatic aicd phosphatase
LGNTAAAFFQGFYPPSGPATAATLTNGSAQFNPLDGYQYVLVNGMPSTAPDSIWIKGDMYCPAMTNASITYYQSTEFLSRQADLQSFYDKFVPLLEGTFPKSAIGFQSAYGIFDYLNVGFVHNHTIFANLSTDDLFQLRTLADEQELALVYNVSSPNTSIGGKTLSGAILSQLNKTFTQTDKNLKITYFAASYSVFQAFFGLSGLLDADADFYGLPDYGSIMSFELRRPVNSTDSNKLFVRYGFRNGSLASAELNTFPLFLRTQIEADIPWNQFVAGMSEQSISNQADWCHACVNSNLTFCAAYTNSTSTSDSGSGWNVGPVGAGFIGAGISISIIAGIEALIAAWWFTRKRRNSMVAADKGEYE